MEGEAAPSRSHTEALLASYLDGQEAAEELLQAVRKDPALAEELAGHLEVERLQAPPPAPGPSGQIGRAHV